MSQLKETNGTRLYEDKSHDDDNGHGTVFTGRKPVSSVPFLWKIAVAVLIVISLVLLVALIVILIQVKGDKTTVPLKPKVVPSEDSSCSSKHFVIDTALPKVPTVFQDLSEDELHSVRDYILKDVQLKVTPHARAKLTDNIIYLIENYLPDKADVLNYLENNGRKPDRRARVILFNGAKAVPDIVEYIVSPLPNPRNHRVLPQSRQVNPLPHYYRPWTILEQKGLAKVYRPATEKAYAILKESFDYWFHNCTDRCLLGLPMGAPGSAITGTRQSVVIFTRKVEGQNLFPVPFLLQIDHKSHNPEEWKILQVIYNNQKFNSVDDLVRKYKNNQLKKIRIPAPTKELIHKASLRQRGKAVPKIPLRPPAYVEPNGKRFSVEGRKVKYMNWEFNIAVQASAGPALYDIRFDGKRIAYELSVQEGTAFYSSYDAKQTAQQYVDTSWGLGVFNWELIRGIDCPQTGVLLDSYHFVDTPKTLKNPDSVCIFERNSGIPIRRHREFKFKKDGSEPEGFWFLGGMVDTALVVRVISTPFNYDYVFDFIFHQNGVMEVMTSTSGYVQTTTYTKHEDDYGFLHFNNTVGTIHDHFILYKVDLDLDGTKNTYKTVDVVPKVLPYEWDVPGDNQTYRTKKMLVQNVKKTEKEGLVHYDFNKPKMYVITNENKKNMFNRPVGYRIQPVYMLKEMYPDKYYVTDAAAWSKYQLAVTKYKDTERFGSCPFNQYDMATPAFHFDSMINDDENIVNEDLVAWVPVGGLHVPNTEDVPTTTMTGNSFAFFLKPFGFFDEDPSMTSTDSMLIEKLENGKIHIDTNNTPKKATCPIPDRDIKYDY